MKIIIGKDFNTRAGRNGGEVQGMEGEDREEEGDGRCSKDESLNREGRKGF